jgi:hypothetical protein
MDEQLRINKITYDLFFCVLVWREQVDGFHVAEVDVMAEQEDEQQLTNVLLLLVPVQRFVALELGPETKHSVLLELTVLGNFQPESSSGNKTYE